MMLPPMALGQCIIAAIVFRRVKAQYSRRVLVLVCALMVLVGIVFMAGALVEFRRFADPLCRMFGWRAMGLTRMVTFLWCFSSTPAVAIYWLVRKAARTASVEHQPERRKLIVNAGRIAVAAPFVITGYGATLGRTDFQVEEVELPVPDLPHDLTRLRILQLSDLHLSPFLSEKELARVIDAANQLRPDIALVTGDLISSPEDPVDAAISQCARLKADRILGCLGNHERYSELEDYVAAQGIRHGINFLRMENETLRYGSADLNFGGVDYQPYKLRDHYIEGADRLIKPGAVNILLTHSPDVLPTAARQGWDISLAGHTHGGQVTFEILKQTLNIARFYTPYVSGFYQLGQHCGYVTRGIGTIGIPARLGATPEITLIRLTRARSSKLTDQGPEKGMPS